MTISKNWMITIATAFATVFLGALSCSRHDHGQAGDQRSAVRLRLSQMTDDQKLLLFEHVPLGATLSEVRDAMPDLGDQRMEGLAGGGLTDAGAELEVVGCRTRVEFNFRHDTLYSVSFGPLNLPADSGDALFDRLSAFYSRRFGTPLVADGQDSPYFVRSRSWPAPWGEVGVINSLAGDRRLLGWGYQPTLNTRSSR
jgi:hypothetical protein